MIRMNERLSDSADLFYRFGDKLKFDLRVAMPAIIQSVDYKKQTCTVSPVIRERIVTEKGYEWKEIPDLPDVPFFILGGGDYAITLPIKKGDECLIVFADSCIDAWWESGKVSNQMERRRHDLSDGFALIGFRSQKNLIDDYDENSLQIRDKEKNISLTLSGEGISVKTKKAEIWLYESGAISIKSTGDSITVESPKEIKIKGSSVSIMDKDFLNHTHSNGNQGSPTGAVI